MLLGFLIVLPIAGGLVGVKLRQFDTMAEVGAAFVPPPTPVNVVEAALHDWQPRLTSVGGMTIGTLFTLFVVPSLYMLIAKAHVAEPDGLPLAESPATPSGR